MMKSVVNRFLAAIGLILLFSFGALAQTSGTDFDIEKFRELATRAEDVVFGGEASTNALEILRSDLVDFRSLAVNAQEIRARRVLIIKKQITALNTGVDNEAEESDLVAQRRVELNGQRAEAQAPLIIAQSAFGRADALIAEIDKTIRRRGRTALLKVTSSPLNPALISTAISAFIKHISAIGTEIRTEWESDLLKRLRRQNAPILLILITIGLILMLPVTRWATRRLQYERDREPTQFGNLKRLLASLAVLTLPTIGLISIFSAIYIADIFSLRGDMFINAIPSAGLALFGANWLACNLSLDKVSGDDLLEEKTKVIYASQRLIWAIGGILAAGFLVDGLDDGAEWSADILSVIMFPLIVLLGYCLFQCGRKIGALRHLLYIESDTVNIPERVATIYMWSCYITGLGGPLLAALGYANAGEVLVFSMSMTLALSAMIFFTYDSNDSL